MKLRRYHFTIPQPTLRGKRLTLPLVYACACVGMYAQIVCLSYKFPLLRTLSLLKFMIRLHWCFLVLVLRADPVRDL